MTTPASRGVGLALAGGGPLGGMYEVGALIALDEALDGVDLHHLDLYVGVSAGAFVSANLANGLSISDIVRIFIANKSIRHPIRPGLFMRPAVREYLRGLRALPGSVARAVDDLVRRPLDAGLFGALRHLQQAIPNAVFANEPLRRFLSELYTSGGRSDDFRELDRQLHIVATNLDTGRPIVFGPSRDNDVPISTAVQASTALPGLFPPVNIDGEDYVDGGLLRTLHASVALEHDVDLLICVNPIVPFDASRSTEDPGQVRLARQGLPVVLSQTFRALIHSRMEVGMGRYEELFPDRDVVLFEPKREDTLMFFSNPFSYASRRRVCEHAYQSTRADLWRRRRVLAPVLARHGITLNTSVLRDRKRHYHTNLDALPPPARSGNLRERLVAAVARLES
ncbi:MAG: patatin-like phospholipase family protein [Pseudomonadota bacterium]